jgi:hypothetical protein
MKHITALFEKIKRVLCENVKAFECLNFLFQIDFTSFLRKVKYLFIFKEIRKKL